MLNTMRSHSTAVALFFCCLRFRFWDQIIKVEAFGQEGCKRDSEGVLHESRRAKDLVFNLVVL